MTEPTPSRTSIKVGDRYTVPVYFQRKWWQLWKPRWWTESREYVVVDQYTEHGHQMLAPPEPAGR